MNVKNEVRNQNLCLVHDKTADQSINIYLHVKSLTCCLLCPSRRIHDSPWLCMVEACYDNFVTTINRALPVCIAVYRWGALVI